MMGRTVFKSEHKKIMFHISSDYILLTFIYSGFFQFSKTMIKYP